MLNTLAQSSTLLPSLPWVKNVHSLWVEHVKLYTTDRVLYTATQTTIAIYQLILVKVQSLTQVLDSFAPSMYTSFIAHFNLLTGHLYTLSTAPTNSKTKEK